MFSEDRGAARRADTLPPEGVHGDVLVVSVDPTFQQRAMGALRAGGWRTRLTETASLVGESLISSDVILLDPLGQRRTLEKTIDAIARMRLRPSVCLALRRREDLAIAVQRSIGCVDADVTIDVLKDAVLRAFRAQRSPRRR